MIMSNSNPGVQSFRNTILSLKNIHKEYDKDDGRGVSSRHVILNNLNLNIKHGEFVTIVGPLWMRQKHPAKPGRGFGFSLQRRDTN
jgi:ATPase subunit of ABC transporter with duplicated ATPase domains